MPTPLLFELSQDEFRYLNRLRFDVRGRAIEIVKLHFRRLHREVQFNKSDDPGVDLFVTVSGRPAFPVQVKGTNCKHIGWDEIRVSSELAFLRLAREKVPIFRIVEVYTPHPRIFRLVCGRDFDLVPDPRWRIRPRDKAAVPSGVSVPSIPASTEGASAWEALPGPFQGTLIGFGARQVWKAGLTLDEVGVEMTHEFGEKVKPFLPDVYRILSKLPVFKGEVPNADGSDR